MPAILFWRIAWAGVVGLGAARVGVAGLDVGLVLLQAHEGAWGAIAWHERVGFGWICLGRGVYQLFGQGAPGEAGEAEEGCDEGGDEGELGEGLAPGWAAGAQAMPSSLMGSEPSGATMVRMAPRAGVALRAPFTASRPEMPSADQAASVARRSMLPSTPRRAGPGRRRIAPSRRLRRHRVANAYGAGLEGGGGNGGEGYAAVLACRERDGEVGRGVELVSPARRAGGRCVGSGEGPHVVRQFDEEEALLAAGDEVARNGDDQGLLPWRRDAGFRGGDCRQGALSQGPNQVIIWAAPSWPEMGAYQRSPSATRWPKGRPARRPRRGQGAPDGEGAEVLYGSEGDLVFGGGDGGVDARGGYRSRGMRRAGRWRIE